MSLPVGTLVMFVNVDWWRPELTGRVGTIVKELGEWPDCYGDTHGLEYGVQVDGHQHWSGRPWLVSRRNVIPITPPGRADDVTTDEPIKEGATC